MTPTIHKDGTQGSVLLERHLTATAAVRDALSALSELAPDWRDYPYRHGAYVLATQAHAADLQALRAILERLQPITTDLREQVELRSLY